MTNNEIPEGFEPLENSVAKEIVYETVYDELDKAGIAVFGDDIDDPQIDLIGLADEVVEKLLAVGVKIPESLWRDDL